MLLLVTSFCTPHRTILITHTTRLFGLSLENCTWFNNTIWIYIFTIKVIIRLRVLPTMTEDHTYSMAASPKKVHCPNNRPLEPTSEGPTTSTCGSPPPHDDLCHGDDLVSPTATVAADPDHIFQLFSLPTPVLKQIFHYICLKERLKLREVSHTYYKGEQAVWNNTTSLNLQREILILFPQMRSRQTTIYDLKNALSKISLMYQASQLNALSLGPLKGKIVRKRKQISVVRSILPDPVAIGEFRYSLGNTVTQLDLSDLLLCYTDLESIRQTFPQVQHVIMRLTTLAPRTIKRRYDSTRVPPEPLSASLKVQGQPLDHLDPGEIHKIVSWAVRAFGAMRKLTKATFRLSNEEKVVVDQVGIVLNYN